MLGTRLTAAELYHECRLDGASFQTTSDLAPLTDILGQPRALEAIRLGIEMEGEGYNVFALGDPGTGKRTLIRQFLQQRAPNRATPSDWCYVNNFEDADNPIALELSAGRGRELRDDIQHLLKDVVAVLPQTFESAEYRQQSELLQQEAVERHQKNLEQLAAEAEAAGFSLSWTPTGAAFSAVKDGKTLSEEEVEALPKDEREDIERRAEGIQTKIMEVMKQVPDLHREARKKLEALNREVARRIFEPPIDELKRKYAGLPKVVAHFESIRLHLLQHAYALMQTGQSGGGEEEVQTPVPYQLNNSEPPAFRMYKVNVLVSHTPGDGAPVVYEENPTFDNLVGRVEYISQMGTLVTDFNLIKAGALHCANGGFLILDAHRLVSNPYAWDSLKQALLAREIRIESPRSMLGLMTTKSLEPDPIPLDVKVILIGGRLLFYMLEAYDPDFPELVKIPADFADEMDRTPAQESLYARLIATLVRRHDLLPFDRSAVERIVEQSSRMAGDSQKLSIRIRSLAGLLREAAYWTVKNEHEVVTRADVQRAIDAQLFRSDRAQSQLREGVRRGILLVDTSGERVGQVNGLAVFPFGELLFGHPSRITVRTRLGEGTVVDIEREVKLGGPTHSKGVLILQGFVTGRYARRRPFALSASIVFEQNYGGVDGDSASSAEVYAMLSSISGVPLKQCFAVTGSVNQWGDVQAIGGVNEKIEGFFDVCRERGLDGTHGVIIPRSNVEHLMLGQDVVAAVERGDFHVHAVATIDEGIELLTGLPAGVADENGEYPEESVNGIVVAKLEHAAQLRRHFGAQLTQASPRNNSDEPPPDQAPPRFGSIR